MSAVRAALAAPPLPRVAIVCGLPLVLEVLEGAFAGLAAVVRLSPDVDDLSGLLRSLDPDAVVLACLDEAVGTGLPVPGGPPVVRLSLREPAVRIFADGAWRKPPSGGLAASPEVVRNLVLAEVFRRHPRP